MARAIERERAKEAKEHAQAADRTEKGPRRG
jgi:hypothetical protein